MSFHVTIRFYEELNFFLPRQMRKQDIIVDFGGRRSVKDFVESMGVPHVEVDLILVHGRSVGFDYIVRDGDRISVYPLFESLDITGVTRLRPEPLRESRFVLDVHLRKLARNLRLFGFDTDYEKERDDDELARIAEEEKRILLTRDRQLLMRRVVDRGLYVRSTDPDGQIREILARLDLSRQCHPFTRCISCNGLLERLDSPVDATILAEIPPGVRSWCDEYHVCRKCRRLYWKGSHYEKLQKKVNDILDEVRK